MCIGTAAQQLHGRCLVAAKQLYGSFIKSLLKNGMLPIVLQASVLPSAEKVVSMQWLNHDVTTLM